MGKAVLIIVFGALVAGSVMYLNTSETSYATASKQAGYQEALLAKEIATSAFGMAQRKLQQTSSYQQALGSINGFNNDGTVNMAGKMTGKYQGGRYEVRAFPIDGQVIKIEVLGKFNEAVENISSYHRMQMLVVNQPSNLTVKFRESQAGYCSAVYLQQFIPISPGDSTTAVTGTISNNGKWFIKNPEMMFVSGNNRDGTSVTPLDLVLHQGTQINFFIGVDVNCSERNVWVDTFNPDVYDWIHYALDTNAEPSQMVEGKHAMIEEHGSSTDTWSIGFEDLRGFSDIQHADIKKNGYGSAWDNDDKTYGGSGWAFYDGYKDLHDYGWKPDFSDQVIEIILTPLTGNEPL